MTLIINEKKPAFNYSQTKIEEGKIENILCVTFVMPIPISNNTLFVSS